MMIRVKVYLLDGELKEHICNDYRVADGVLYILNRSGNVNYPLVAIKKFETERY